MVKTPGYSGLMDMLAQQYKLESDVEIQFHSSSRPHQRARASKADMVISHYGKAGMEKFVMDGLGHWPVMLFANQAAIIGPKSDPAGIRGLSAIDAYKKLAASDQPFVANQLPGPNFLDGYLFAESGSKQPLSARSTVKAAKKQAARKAEQQQAYFIWGALPFIKYSQETETRLDILVAADPIFHRVMASSVVKGSEHQQQAKAFEAFLIRPDTQAKIAQFRPMGSERQLWWPYGRHN